MKPVAGPRDRLRDATVSAHQRLDGLLAGGLADIDTYHGYLCGMHRFISDAEATLGEPPLRSLWLSGDLVALGLPPLPPLGRVTAIADEDERLGWRYVIAGSSMGARVLVRDARALGFTADHGAGFLARHAIDGEWPGIVRRIGDVADADREARMCAGALAAFAAADTCLRHALFLDPTP